MASLGQINGSKPSHFHVGRIQLARLVRSYPDNEMEDEVTIEEADQYFWLQSTWLSKYRQNIVKQEIRQVIMSGEVDKSTTQHYTLCTYKQHKIPRNHPLLYILIYLIYHHHFTEITSSC